MADGPLLLLRCDVDERMGLGHLTRSLALGNCWRSFGGRVLLLTRRSSRAFLRRIPALAVPVKFLANDMPPGADGSYTAAVARSHCAAWVMADGYHLTGVFQRALTRGGARWGAFDDLGLEPFEGASLIINQNPGARAFSSRYPRSSLLLCGPKFIQLRPDVAKAKPRIRRGAVRRILLTLGGRNRLGDFLRVLSVFPSELDAETEITVVLGPRMSRPEPEAVRQAFRRDVTWIYSPRDWVSLLNRADIAVTAAGVTAWELAFLGVPSILIATAENQVNSAKGLSKAGAACWAGMISACALDRVRKHLLRLGTDPPLCRRMGAAARKFVDGRGGSRVASVLWSSFGGGAVGMFRLRRARAGDARDLWRFANEPSVAARRRSRRPIGWRSHSEWFNEKVSSPRSCHWVIEAGGVIAGQIRYDLADDRDGAVISYSVWPLFRKRGLGTRLIRSTWRLAMKELRTRSVSGFVHEDNLASRRSFLRAGFREIGEAPPGMLQFFREVQDG